LISHSFTLHFTNRSLILIFVRHFFHLLTRHHNLIINFTLYHDFDFLNHMNLRLIISLNSFIIFLILLFVLIIIILLSLHFNNLDFFVKVFILAVLEILGVVLHNFFRISRICLSFIMLNLVCFVFVDNFDFLLFPFIFPYF